MSHTASFPVGTEGQHIVPRSLRWLVAGGCVAFVFGFTAADAATVVNSVFNPTAFTALDGGGGLVLTAGDSLTFDTASLQLSGTIGGAPVSFNGVAASSQGGGVELAVFTFSSVNIGSGATVDVTGTRGLVLGSQTNFYLGSTLGGLVGQPGTIGTSSPSGGSGGVGAEGGVRGDSLQSNPPGANRGDGGNAGVNVTNDGVGYGAGAGAASNQRAGGGGAYGGAGGAAATGGGAGGAIYGDATLTELYGGSGGGGARHISNAIHPYGGGGGGGALELVAAGTLTIDTTLSLAGGAGGGTTGQYNSGGGGGSGGGAILAADQLHFGSGALLSVGGGAGGPGWAVEAVRHGGGGGGGRVALYAGSVTGISPATAVNLAGGTATGGGVVGADGSLYQNGYVHSPFVAPYVRVDFNDMSGGNVNGQAGGMGLTGTWSTPVAAGQQISIVAGDLVAPASTNFALTQSGTPQSLQGMNNTFTVDKASRSLAAPLTGIVWFSFLMEPTSDGRGGIDLNNGRIIAHGSTLRTILPGADTAAPNAFALDTVSLVLGKLEIDAGASGEDHLRLWVNPDVTLGPDGLGSPTHQVLSTNWMGSTGITTLHIESYAGAAGNAKPRIDLITLSSGPTAYFDVTGVPEPSALLLLAVAGAMLCTFRGKRER